MDCKYELHYNQLKRSLEKNKDNEAKKFSELKKFSLKHFVLPTEWKLLEELQPKVFNQSRKKACHIITDEMRVNTFNANPGNEHIEWIRPQSLEKTNMKVLEKALLYPHKNYRSSYTYYRCSCANPLTKPMQINFENVMELSKSIPEATADDETWLEFIKKITYDKAVIANIELRFQKDKSCLNKDIWKYYIGFMRTKNPIDLLNVYRRYCRLFMDDDNMREEYHKEIERFGEAGVNVMEYWIDAIRYVLDFKSRSWAQLLLTKALKTLKFEPDQFQNFGYNQNNEDVFTKFENMVESINAFKMQKTEAPKRQLPPLPGPPVKRFRLGVKNPKSYLFPSKEIPRSLGAYILKNANPQMLYKLQSTCMYIFASNPYPICYRLLIEPNARQRYVQQSLCLPPSAVNNFHGLKNLIISNSLTCKALSNDGKALSILKSKICKCEANFIYFNNQSLMEEEFIYYVKSGKVENILLKNVDVIKENGILLSAAEIKEIIVRYNKHLSRMQVI